MKLCHALTCCVLLTLWDENTGVGQETGVVGGNFTYQCRFYFSGKRKLFCKTDCENDNVLVETTEDSKQNGRHRIKYTNALTEYSVISVSITNLKKSDSGRYRCSLDRLLFPNAEEDFDIRVVDAPVTFPPSSTSLTPTATRTSTQHSSSSSGGPRPSPTSPETTDESGQRQTVSAAGSGVLLAVALTLVAMAAILSAAVLMLCWKRSIKDPPVETDVTQADRRSEEIRENRRGRVPPADLVYSYAKPNAVETTNEYSLVTAPRSQSKPEDDSSKLDYTEVSFSGAAASLSGAPHVNPDDTIYSVLK